MISGNFDRQIILMCPTESENDYGEVISSFEAYGSVFASVFQSGSKEIYQSGKVSEIDMVFKTRYMPTITEKWQVVYDGVTYEIVGRPKELGRQDGLEIMGRAMT